MGSAAEEEILGTPACRRWRAVPAGPIVENCYYPIGCSQLITGCANSGLRPLLHGWDHAIASGSDDARPIGLVGAVANAVTTPGQAALAPTSGLETLRCETGPVLKRRRDSSRGCGRRKPRSRSA
jgi:hypothetical protein